jgi:hypothetical protein
MATLKLSRHRLAARPAPVPADDGAEAMSGLCSARAEAHHRSVTFETYPAVCIRRDFHMTAQPQIHPDPAPAQDRSPAGIFPAAPAAADTSGGARGGLRQMPPALDASTVFGCVDWFLYPEAESRTAARA